MCTNKKWAGFASRIQPSILRGSLQILECLVCHSNVGGRTRVFTTPARCPVSVPEDVITNMRVARKEFVDHRHYRSTAAINRSELGQGEDIVHSTCGIEVLCKHLTDGNTNDLFQDLVVDCARCQST